MTGLDHAIDELAKAEQTIRDLQAALTVANERIGRQQQEIAELHMANNGELLADMYDDANAEARAGCYRGMSEWGM